MNYLGLIHKTTLQLTPLLLTLLANFKHFFSLLINNLIFKLHAHISSDGGKKKPTKHMFQIETIVAFLAAGWLHPHYKHMIRIHPDLPLEAHLNRENLKYADCGLDST